MDLLESFLRMSDPFQWQKIKQESKVQIEEALIDSDTSDNRTLMLLSTFQVLALPLFVLDRDSFTQRIAETEEQNTPELRSSEDEEKLEVAILVMRDYCSH